ncbi:unnamed protein product [Hymenolepis diminuta]|uniref:RING-type domain-containing protein n=1 Tax=Hymenolepis diminuta TaxID=6216 RepID=A0A564YGZ8_HYMDI|nr:unnamed protein product [Hymenolepis diminuta]
MAYISKDNLKCTICKNLYVDVVSLPCAHNFCKKCILAHLREKQACPSCNKPADINNVEPDEIMRQIINNLRAHPTKKLNRCANCDSNLCDECLERHLDNLKREDKMAFIKEAPERMMQLKNYRDRLDKVETHIFESTESAENSLRQHEESLNQKLGKMLHCGLDVGSPLTQQLKEANGLSKRIKDLIEESYRGTILDSTEINNLLSNVDNLELRFKELQNDLESRSPELPLNEHAAQCLRDFDDLEKRRLA